MTLEHPEILFVGWNGTDGVTHYRTILPATAMGAEFVVFDSRGNGIARQGTNKKHEIIVLQHCWHGWQVRIARNMQKMGAKVLVNVDDWVPAVGKLGDSHSFSKEFADKALHKEYMSLLREADGILCATPWLVERCSKINRNVALARNGLDLDRYYRFADFEPTDYDRIVLGWAGGTGHVAAFEKIVPALEQILDEHPHVEVHFVGDDHSSMFASGFTDRLKHYAWSDMAFYPRNLARFDINLAPALESDFYKAKSQLRFYEACAMGTPTIGHPMYDEIGWGVTGAGYTAVEVEDWFDLLDTTIRLPTHCKAMASRARQYAEEISIEKRITEWTAAIQRLTSSQKAL